MSAVGNLTRDMFWLKPGLSPVTFSTTSGRLNSDGLVQQTKGIMTVGSSSGGSNRRAGLMMDQPEGIDTPYRVQVYSRVTPDYSYKYYLAIGYATTQTGTNDTIANEILIPIPNSGHLDEIFAIEGADQPYPIYFAIRSSDSIVYNAVISVQKLNEVHPQYQSTVS